ncbi:MAG: branched-chain amino acid aminotransferase [Clostridia bacterium]|jgi:branched-chain amino acid aminotransferase
MNDIRIELSTNPKEKPADESKLSFGEIFTDHMFCMNYTAGKGWYDARIIPYGPFQLDPSAMVFHYGQAVFDGLKAYRGNDGKARMFRPWDNFARMNQSARRLCIPEIDEEFALKALKELLEVEKDWIPSAQDTSLYIRPTIIATDPFLGVRASNTYLFYIILSPVGPYYPEGLKPVKIYVEDYYARSVKGGTGFAKTAGNYAASLLAGELAKEKGYSQVLWLDGCRKEYVEEVGAMNIFFKLKGELVTPPLEGTILGGITRDSVIKLAGKMGIPVHERAITIQEVYEAHADGTLEEVFGTGTAAVISAVGELNWKGNRILINKGEMGPLSQKLYDTLTGIQLGHLEDPFGWLTVL